MAEEIHNRHSTDMADDFGDSHHSFSTETPLRPDAFVLSDDEKITKIQEYMNEDRKQYWE